MERAASQAQAAERCSWLALGRRAIRRPPDGRPRRGAVGSAASWPSWSSWL